MLFKQEPVGLPLAAAAAVAQTLCDEAASAGDDPFSRRDGWRSHGEFVRRFAFEFGAESGGESGSKTVQAQLRYAHDGAQHLTVGEGADAVAGPLAWRTSGAGLEVGFNGQRSEVRIDWQGETAHVFASHGATQIVEVDLLAHAGEAAAEGGRLTAPMPGKVVSFAVQAGDTVKKGQALAVLEAMKMEHTIAAPADGQVAELLYAPGDQVAEGAELLKLVLS